MTPARLFVFVGFACAVFVGATPSAQNDPADPLRTVLLQNDTLAVTHLRFAPGQREVTHTHAFPIAIVQLTPGEISVQEQNVVKRSSGKPGEVWYIASGQPHGITSAASATKSVDMMSIALWADRPPAPAAPATAAPEGIMRATLVDNNDMRIVRVRFSPGSREPVHTHPNDLLTIQITRGKVDIQMGTEHQSADREPGFIQFLPRNVPHAYISQDTKPFELLSIAVK